MKNFNKYGFTFLLSSMLFAACNSNNPKEGEETTPSPVEKDDVSRYNINEPDKSVLKLDSTTVDTARIDTVN
ncbi:hypothetical protein GQF61_14595 [Sphingobacterium sp. DK4209]|uniref:Uncharacterized protein n=1 Tax=Sphingobacterium zhuxiongii TaxID=2662364 RepID=A0A5Q0QD49_9SPHI|nr:MULTISPECIES: hypothetical protein [unclassified Sphingobacterium]MVZ67088.1 hypothetical protein [Sphingobacterium sp. DK4209]QGA26841.1 hypothetical protein GFH32_11155 [Sphingobacterium sp. dk4302]